MTVAPLTEQLSCAMHCARRFTSISLDHQVKSSSSEHYKEGVLTVTAEEAGAKGTKASKTSPKSHSWEMAQPGFKPRPISFQSLCSWPPGKVQSGFRVPIGQRR